EGLVRGILERRRRAVVEAEPAHARDVEDVVEVDAVAARPVIVRVEASDRVPAQRAVRVPLEDPHIALAAGRMGPPVVVVARDVDAAVVADLHTPRGAEAAQREPVDGARDLVVAIDLVDPPGLSDEEEAIPERIVGGAIERVADELAPLLEVRVAEVGLLAVEAELLRVVFVRR